MQNQQAILKENKNRTLLIFIFFFWQSKLKKQKIFYEKQIPPII